MNIHNDYVAAFKVLNFNVWVSDGCQTGLKFTMPVNYNLKLLLQTSFTSSCLLAINHRARNSILLAMSSLRNSLHRPSHKERSQLSHRAKLGILEKHSDYVLRARDYHSKRDRIKRLKQKVADRNKDEFYFGMVRQKTQVRFEGNMELKSC